ncbi:MAG: hypothetical protein ACRD13_13880 [Terriglobales bacterium]
MEKLANALAETNRRMDETNRRLDETNRRLDATIITLEKFISRNGGAAH